MPRAKTPAAVEAAPPPTPEADAPATDTPTPADVADHQGDAEAPNTADGPAWGNWRYTGTSELIYPSVPVTARPGDVVEHCGPPAADGRWELTEEPVTRHRDNHIDEPEPEPVDAEDVVDESAPDEMSKEG